MEIKNAKDLTAADVKLSAAVYGKSGTGKTTFGASFPKPFFLDIDGGLLSVRGQDVSYVDLTPGRGVTWPNILDAIAEGKKDDYESIIVDSLTGLADLCMESVLQLNRRSGQKPNFDDWAAYANKIKDFIVRLLSSGKNTLLICHEAPDKDELTGHVWMLPAIQGQMKSRIANYFDEFYHAEVEQTPGKPSNYRLLARPSSIFTAKSRLLSRDTESSYLVPSFQSLMNLQRHIK